MRGAVGARQCATREANRFDSMMRALARLFGRARARADDDGDDDDGADARARRADARAREETASNARRR